MRLANVRAKIWPVLVVTVLVSVTGAIAALGDTLFPAGSLQAGMRQDLSSTSSILLRLRMIHPLVAVLGAALVIWVAASFTGKDEGRGRQRAAWAVIGFTVLQLLLGILNLALLAPMAMQLIHLLIADVVWIAVLVLGLETASRATARAEDRVRSHLIVT
jgi:heme A synthase